MDEPKISDYPLTDQGASDFSAATQIYRNQQRNDLRLVKRAQAAKLLAQNDALPPDSGVPGSRNIESATESGDNMYAVLGAGARVVSPVAGILGTLANEVKQSIPQVIPSEIKYPLATSLDAFSRGSKNVRDQSRQTAEGFDRYLEARRLLQEKIGFSTPSAISAAGEVMPNLIGGPVTQAALAYGERDSLRDVAESLVGAKIARKIPFNAATFGGSPTPLASIAAQQKVSELLAAKLFGDLRKKREGK